MWCCPGAVPGFRRIWQRGRPEDPSQSRHAQAATGSTGCALAVKLDPRGIQPGERSGSNCIRSSPRRSRQRCRTGDSATTMRGCSPAPALMRSAPRSALDRQGDESSRPFNPGAARSSKCSHRCHAPLVRDQRRRAHRDVCSQDGRNVQGATRAFGTPSGSYGRGETCTAIWRQYGLTIFFYNLGGKDACVPRYGYFSKAIMAKGIWRTASGLRVGMRTRAIRRYFPNATFRRGVRYGWPSGWWLVTRTSHYGNGGDYPGLLADTRSGRVFAFQVRHPAGGD
jgi:hypothetical protein